MNTFTRKEENSLKRTVLEIDINNHPGAMSHVVGLFSRRAFNIEGIHCVPVGDSQKSRIWLLLKADERVPQLIKLKFPPFCRHRKAPKPSSLLRIIVMKWSFFGSLCSH